MSGHPISSVDPSLESKSRSTGEVVRRVSVFLKPYKAMAAANLACALLAQGFSFVYPRLVQFLIDDVINGKKAHLFVPALLGLLGAFLFRDLFNSLRIRVNNVFEQNVIFDMRKVIFSRLQRLPIGFFDQRASGDLMTRVIEDVNSVERVLIDGTETGATASLAIILGLFLLFSANWKLALLGMVPLPILAGGAMWYTLTAHTRYRAQRKAASAMNSMVMDALQGIRQIKAYNRHAFEDRRLAEKADELRSGTLGVMRVWSLYSPAMSFAGALGTVLVLWVGGLQVLHGEMTLGKLWAFTIYLGLFYEPISRLHGLNQMLQSARAAGERVFDILDTTEEGASAARHGTLTTPVRGGVIYRNVSFGYGPDKQVLKNVSLNAKPGDMIALVGPTGAGKSTIVNLLPAFYECQSGEITIDGQNISRVTLDSLREQISVVSQEPFLFNGTIRENLIYGNPECSEAQLLECTQAANCFEFIDRLPDKFESRVGERGVKLSVGEKQRISIARALLKNAPILILDEATASVDTATERLIQEALERLMKDRTSFVIAHRLSTIRKANQILVLQRGEVIERGTHEELLEKQGLYSRLARVQDSTFIEERFEKLEAQPG